MPSQDPQTDHSLSGPRDMLRAARRLLRREAWLIGLAILGLVALELFLRQAYPQLAGLVYAEDITGGHKIELTEDGYRLPPGSTLDKGGDFILAVGDSTTFGTGVGAAETWPLQLQSQLNSPLNVRNAGFEGGDLRRILYGFDEIWSQPEPPRAVVLLITANMVSFTDFRRDSTSHDPLARARKLNKRQDRAPSRKQKLSRAVQSSALWKAVVTNINAFKFAIGLQNHLVKTDRPLSPLMAYGWVQPDMPDVHYTRMWNEFEAQLTRLRDATAAQGSCLVVGFLPPRFTLSDSRRDNMKFVPKARLSLDAEQRVTALAEAAGIPVAPVAQALRMARDAKTPGQAPLYIPGDYTHLDPEGHAIVAQAVAQTYETIRTGDPSCPGVAAQ